MSLWRVMDAIKEDKKFTMVKRDQYDNLYITKDESVYACLINNCIANKADCIIQD